MFTSVGGCVRTGVQSNVLCNLCRMWMSWRGPGIWAQLWWALLEPAGQGQLMRGSSSSHLSVMTQVYPQPDDYPGGPGCVQEPMTLGPLGTLWDQPHNVPLLSCTWPSRGRGGEGKRGGEDRVYRTALLRVFSLIFGGQKCGTKSWLLQTNRAPLWAPSARDSMLLGGCGVPVRSQVT